MKSYIITAFVALAVIAIVFRVTAVRSIVVGA